MRRATASRHLWRALALLARAIALTMATALWCNLTGINAPATVRRPTPPTTPTWNPRSAQLGHSWQNTPYIPGQASWLTQSASGGLSLSLLGFRHKSAMFYRDDTPLPIPSALSLRSPLTPKAVGLEAVACGLPFRAFHGARVSVLRPAKQGSVFLVTDTYDWNIIDAPHPTKPKRVQIPFGISPLAFAANVAAYAALLLLAARAWRQCCLSFRNRSVAPTAATASDVCPSSGT